MDHRSLVLLGLLMAQSQHGYQINEFIENNMSMITNMKKPTAYATLDKLSKQGFIEVNTEREGNRPPRKVYTINEKGRTYFYELLIENLSSGDAVEYEGDIGLMFIEHLPLEKAINALQQRLAKTEQSYHMFKSMPDHGTAIGVNLAISHKKKMLEAEVSFLKETIAKLSVKQSG